MSFTHQYIVFFSVRSQSVLCNDGSQKVMNFYWRIATKKIYQCIYISTRGYNMLKGSLQRRITIMYVPSFEFLVRNLLGLRLSYDIWLNWIIVNGDGSDDDNDNNVKNVIFRYNGAICCTSKFFFFIYLLFFLIFYTFIHTHRVDRITVKCSFDMFSDITYKYSRYKAIVS